MIGRILGWKKYERPTDMKESHWGMVFDACLERYDAFQQGFVTGIVFFGIVLLFVSLITGAIS